MEEQNLNNTYDIIILGTGITECVLSGLLSIKAEKNYKILHIDRNSFYGGESASVNLDQLYKKFNKGDPPQYLGHMHKYNIDLIPKVLMSNGELVKILRPTVAERYNMEFMLINNSYVLQNGKIQKIPVTESDAKNSSLMGIFEKFRMVKFLNFVVDYDKNKEKKDYHVITSRQLFNKFSLDKNTISFIGHAIALYSNDLYLDMPAHDMIMNCKLYKESLDLYSNSPYIYPSYGLGEISQAFSRLGAVYGGTYMLGTPIKKINFNNLGKFESIVYNDDKIAYANMILGDPSYFPDKVKSVGKVARCIAIMDHPIKTGVDDGGSMQIIIPQSELKRNNDMYILQFSSDNKVCPEGFYIAIISTVVENMSNPIKDLEYGISMLGKTIETFISISDMFEPIDNNDRENKKCFISSSYDSATHFENTAGNILELFEKITGKPYNF